jgi:hypothetical protein
VGFDKFRKQAVAQFMKQVISQLPVVEKSKQAVDLINFVMEE